MHLGGKGEVMFEKEIMVSENGEDEDALVRRDGYGAVFKFREEKDRGKVRACSRGFTHFYYKDGFCTR